MNIVWLIGMPGAGKTHWAKLIAEHYGYEMLDMDAYIMQQTGMTVAEIFEKEGAAYFRREEAEAIDYIVTYCAMGKMVVACGGGVPAYGSNMQIMKNSGCVIYLDVDVDVLTTRVESDTTDRPLLADRNISEQLTQLYKNRKQYYQQAHYTVHANELQITDFDKIIRLCIERQ